METGEKVLPTPEELDDCGPLALVAVALHHGRAVELARARELCGTERGKGTSLLGLQRGAEALGFETRAARATWEALAKLPLPLIAHVEIAFPRSDGKGEPHLVLGQFVVVTEVGRGALSVLEANVGAHEVSREDFERIWTRRLLLVVPRERG